MQKRDLEIMRQLKREESKVKIEKEKENKVLEELDKNVNFDAWWVETNKKLSLPIYMKEIILADFKGRGLSTSEKPSKFNEALILFGYKI